MESLSISPEAYRLILEGIADGVYIVDLGRRILYWNPAAARLTGYSAEETVNRSCFDNILMHVDCRGTNLCVGKCPLLSSLLEGKTRRADVYLHHKDGHRVPVEVTTTPVYDQAGTIVAAVEIFRSNTKVTRMRDRLLSLKEQALTDCLTDLPNRRCLEKHLAAALKELHAGGAGFSVLLVDIDRFKSVNDTFGHERGDQVLRMVANTLAHAVAEPEIVGRWGGEEFLALLPGDDPGELQRTAELMRILVTHSHLVMDQRKVEVTVSIGATPARPDDSLPSLVERADRCLYASKEAGRNRVTLDGCACSA